MTSPRDASAVEALRALHRRVDERAGALAARHRDRLQCRRGCSGCCVDGLEVHSIEAALIRERSGALLERSAPHPEGACAFLDGDGACRIYDVRPYVCRTQGLPLRWLAGDGPGGTTVERRDICPLNDEGEPLVALDPGDCFTLGPVEGELAQLEERFTGKRPRRIPLRTLFAPPGSP